VDSVIAQEKEMTRTDPFISNPARKLEPLSILRFGARWLRQPSTLYVGSPGSFSAQRKYS